MDIGFVTAFVGGALALLSPCAALLLPAFFASTVNSGPKLFVHVAVFYAGLLTVLVPLGVGAGALGSLFISSRDTLITVSAILLILLGVVQIFGIGFDPSKLMPGHGARQSASTSATGLTKTFLLGTTSGIAGFCAGPILGAVLTMAAASSSTVTAGLLLAVYGAGMVVPLLIIVLLWRPLGSRGQGILKGRGFTLFGYRFHTTSVITGLIITATGIIFWATNGLLGMPELVSYETQAGLQEGAGLLANPVVDLVAILVIAAIILGIWYWRRSASATRSPHDDSENLSDTNRGQNFISVREPGRTEEES